MAIDPTRNLPSFSEMYSAFKNRGNLGQAIDAGVDGYLGQKASLAKQAKEAADTKEATSHANYYDKLAEGGIEKKIPLAALGDDARQALLPYVDKDGNITESQAKIYLTRTGQDTKSDDAAKQLAVKQAAFDETKRHNDQVTQKDKEIADLRNQLGQSGQGLSAAQTVANVTSKEDPPGFMETYVGSPIKKAVTGTDTASVIAEKQKQAALAKLSQTGGIPTDNPQVTPSTEQLITPPPATPAPRSVRKPGKPVPVYTAEDYDKLAVGASYIDSSGKVKVKGK